MLVEHGEVCIRTSTQGNSGLRIAQNDHGLFVKKVKLIKPQLHIHDFGNGRATIHPALSNREASV